ncbi:MAG: DUF4954 family protein, partial [Candidatus Omnitrophota bacterium]|nr:DUF4954 family protein [Candidatus Omnitrophota bacterium]
LIAQPGVEINGANVVMGVDDGAHGVLMLEHSHAGNGATVKDSVIAPNTGVEKGESTSSFLGPFIGMHHNSLVIAVDWAAGMGNVGAGVLDGSNHPGRAPDQEEQNGEGTFLGLGSMYSFSGNYADSPYTMFGKGVSMLPSRMAMPFSLVQKPTVQIPGESPEFMEINPAWGWSDNAYMPMRNEGKYASRDKSSRNGLKATGNEDPLLRRIPFEILRPDTVNQMIRARDVLAKVDLATAKKVKFEGDKETILYYTGPKSEKKVQPGEIPELGKTFMRESSRDKAVKTYTAMIQYYGAKGLWAEIQKLAAADRLSEVPALLSTPSVDLRWEHERRVLLTELPGKTVPDILRFLVESQERLAKQVRTSKEKDDERGERILDDYGETHTIAANDKFVKQSAAAAAKLRSDVEALLPQLATGVEEVEVLAAELQRGLPNIQIPAAPSTTATIVDLTVDENGRANPAAALIVPYLPVGTVAIVRSMDDLMTAEQLAGRTTQAAVVFIGERDFEFVLVEALRAVLPGAGVQLLSGRSEGEIRRALAVASRRDASLPKVAEIMAPKALAAILDALGVDEATRTAFMTLFQRAQDNWDGLVQYL